MSKRQSKLWKGKGGFVHSRIKDNLVSFAVLSRVWDGCANPGSGLPDQPGQQPPPGGLRQRATRHLAGLQQRPL